MMLVHRVPRGVSVAAAVVLAACSASDSRMTLGPQPRAEFLLAAADSTFWITTGSGPTKVRGAPMILAKFDGRYYEVFASHDDLSYPDASFLGDRIYRRDLMTGDSTVVIADTLVPHMAKEYAAAHPGERPLRPNDEGEDADPATSITAEFDIMDVFGPYLSYEYHIDVEAPSKAPWHSTRQGVLDLRTGKAPAAVDLFGKERAARLTADARRAYAVIRDSIVRAESSLRGEDRRTAAELAELKFDESSFTLKSIDGQLAVSFGIPGHGEGVVGEIVELDPQQVDSVAWWPSLATGLPVGDDEGKDRWHGLRYQVIARYDTSRTVARLSLLDGGEREWPIASVQAPLFQILWLDNPPVRDKERQALVRAFNHAASYEEGARIADVRSEPRYFHFVTSHASSQNRPRKSPRNLRAHDAPGCQQHGACVRRRDFVDDGQDRGHRGISSQPRQRRDGLDRSRGVSRADSRGRSRGDEGQCQLRGADLDGSRRPRGSRRFVNGSAPSHQLVLSDLRCR